MNAEALDNIATLRRTAMSNEEFRKEAENPPAGGVPPPKTARSKKSNGGTAPDPDEPPIEIKSGSGPDGETTPEDLDADEAEFARLRRDLPNVGGSAAVGIVAIGVTKAPPKNVFFRARKGFRPIVDLVVDQVRLDQKYYAVDPSMTAELTSVGIAYAAHTLYLIITPTGGFRIIPVRCPDGDGDRNEYAATKELALRQSEDNWVRIYTDMENTCYRVFTAEPGRYPEPVWPPIPDAKIFRLCFRDRGYLIDTPEHPRFIEWIGRKPKDDGQ
jgi:hypothetical protein